jgi:hypothetical protein
MLDLVRLAARLTAGVHAARRAGRRGPPAPDARRSADAGPRAAPGDAPGGDHPLLAGLRRTHDWEELTGRFRAMRARLAGARIEEGLTIHVRAAAGASRDRAILVSRLAGGRVFVEDTSIGEDVVRYRCYLLRPRGGGPPPALPAQ